MQHTQLAGLVADDARMAFLPMLFSDDFFFAEQHVYQYADRFCQDYHGGYWHFYTLPDGGGYMAPEIEQQLFTNQLNGFSAPVSGDAAGIILTSLVLNQSQLAAS